VNKMDGHKKTANFAGHPGFAGTASLIAAVSNAAGARADDVVEKYLEGIGESFGDEILTNTIADSKDHIIDGSEALSGGFMDAWQSASTLAKNGDVSQAAAVLRTWGEDALEYVNNRFADGDPPWEELCTVFLGIAFAANMAVLAVWVVEIVFGLGNPVADKGPNAFMSESRRSRREVPVSGPDLRLPPRDPDH